MKKTILPSVLAAAFILAPAVTASGQELKTSYFLDHNNYGYRINPAYVPEDNVSAFWGLLIDNVSAASNSNIGLNSFLFPVNGELVTGLHESVPAEQFLGGLNTENILNAAANMNLFTVGFRTDPKGFATVEFNIRTNNYVNLPKGLFEFLKKSGREGSTNQFNINNMQIRTTNIGELALGYSRKIGDKFKVGGRLKILLGIADADMTVDNMTIDIPKTAADQWKVTGEGSMRLSASVRMSTKEIDGKDVYNFNTLQLDYIGLGGFGGAVDLGVKYSPIESLEIDAAVQDLGLMFWNRAINGLMDYCSYFTNEEMQAIKDDISKILNYTPLVDASKFRQMLNARLMVGARYRMNFYDRLSVGINDTFRTGYYKYNDLRIGATVTPIDQISITANYGYTSYGHAMGIAANFNLGFAQLFLGTDGVIFNVTPQFVPIDNLNSTVNIGLLIQIKKNNG